MVYIDSMDPDVVAGFYAKVVAFRFREAMKAEVEADESEVDKTKAEVDKVDETKVDETEVDEATKPLAPKTGTERTLKWAWTRTRARARARARAAKQTSFANLKPDETEVDEMEVDETRTEVDEAEVDETRAETVLSPPLMLDLSNTPAIVRAGYDEWIASGDF